MSVRNAMAEHGLDAAIVTAPEEVYYLSGLRNQGHFVFTALVMSSDPETTVLVAREMEAPTAALQARGCDFAGYSDGRDPAELLCTVLATDGGDKQVLGYQPESLSFPIAAWRTVDRELGSPTWVDCTPWLSNLQQARTDREIRHLRRAGQLSDLGMQAGIDAAAEGCTGGQIVGAIEDAMLTAGSDYPGFVPLVRPITQIRQEHVAWTADAIQHSDSLFLELSAASGRYHAPLARTVRAPDTDNPAPADELAHAGLETIIQGLRPGRTAAEVYQDWRVTIEARLGHPYPRHHCGYFVGIGFPPSWMAGRVDSLRPENRLVLRPGMTFHIQSWVVDDQLGTAAMSDTAMVTINGGELLTATPHHPMWSTKHK
ncbi:MAG TPA: Xaa-Pro peptidase family protein [Microlunatus sp.]